MQSPKCSRLATLRQSPRGQEVTRPAARWPCPGREQRTAVRLRFHSCTALALGDEIRPRQEAVFLNSKLLFLHILLF